MVYTTNQLKKYLSGVAVVGETDRTILIRMLSLDLSCVIKMCIIILSDFLPSVLISSLEKSSIKQQTPFFSESFILDLSLSYCTGSYFLEEIGHWYDFYICFCDP